MYDVASIRTIRLPRSCHEIARAPEPTAAGSDREPDSPVVKKNTGPLAPRCVERCHRYCLLTVLVGTDWGTTFATVIVLSYHTLCCVHVRCVDRPVGGARSPRPGWCRTRCVSVCASSARPRRDWRTHPRAGTAPTAFVRFHRTGLCFIAVRRTV